MKELLQNKHGIVEISETRRHLHAYIDKAVLDKVDELIPRRMRSRFVESCLKREIAELEELNGWRTTRRTRHDSQFAEWGSSQSRHSGKANQCWHRNQSGSDRASGWVGEIKKNSRQSNSQNCDSWLRQSFQLIERVDALGEAAGTALPHWTVYMGNQSLVFVMAEGSASSLSKASPPQHGVEHDRKSYRSHCVRQSRTKVQGQNHKSPYRTSLEEDLVAHSSFLYQSKICERSKTSEKKLGAKRLISGD